MAAGSFGGALAAGWISDRLGRRKSLMVSSIIWIIAAVLQCSAQNVAHLIVGRVVGGISSSFNCLPYDSANRFSRYRLLAGVCLLG